MSIEPEPTRQRMLAGHMRHCFHPMNTVRRSGVFFFLCMALALQLGPCFAQVPAWPIKPLRFIVPQPAGGSNDAVGRAVAETLARALGHNVIVENRPGAAGSTGMEAVFAAAHDGYTLAVASDSVALQPLLRQGLKWNIERDFVPIMMFGVQPIVVAVPASSPYRTVQDLISAARATPDKIGYATSGQGSIQHLAGELLAQMTGVDLLHVPYKGGGQAVSDLVSGQIPAAVLGLAAVLPHAKAGRVRVLAVSTKTRSDALPSAPTLHETVAPGYDVRQWCGLMAPAGTPTAVLTRLQAEIGKALESVSLRERMEKLGFEVSALASSEFNAYLVRDRARWARIITDRKLVIE